jgi:hypothetical protein
MGSNVRAIMIVEIAGRPPEHVKATLETHVGQMRTLKDIEVFSITVSDPREIDGSEGMFTCFAEVEFGAESFARLTEIVFDFMPSSVEVIEPAELKMGMADATSFLNNLTGRLHRYDEIAKLAQMQNQQLAKKMQIMQQELMERDAKKTKPVKKKKVTKKKSGGKKAKKSSAKKAAKKTSGKKK